MGHVLHLLANAVSLRRNCISKARRRRNFAITAEILGIRRDMFVNELVQFQFIRAPHSLKNLRVKRHFSSRLAEVVVVNDEMEIRTTAVACESDIELIKVAWSTADIIRADTRYQVDIAALVCNRQVSR